MNQLELLKNFNHKINSIGMTKIALTPAPKPTVVDNVVSNVTHDMQNNPYMLPLAMGGLGMAQDLFSRDKDEEKNPIKDALLYGGAGFLFNKLLSKYNVDPAEYAKPKDTEDATGKTAPAPEKPKTDAQGANKVNPSLESDSRVQYPQQPTQKVVPGGFAGSDLGVAGGFAEGAKMAPGNVAQVQPQRYEGPGPGQPPPEGSIDARAAVNTPATPPKMPTHIEQIARRFGTTPENVNSVMANIMTHAKNQGTVSEIDPLAVAKNALDPEKWHEKAPIEHRIAQSHDDYLSEQARNQPGLGRQLVNTAVDAAKDTASGVANVAKAGLKATKEHFAPKEHFDPTKVKSINKGLTSHGSVENVPLHEKLAYIRKHAFIEEMQSLGVMPMDKSLQDELTQIKFAAFNNERRKIASEEMKNGLSGSIRLPGGSELKPKEKKNPLPGAVRPTV